MENNLHLFFIFLFFFPWAASCDLWLRINKSSGPGSERQHACPLKALCFSLFVCSYPSANETRWVWVPRAVPIVWRNVASAVGRGKFARFVLWASWKLCNGFSTEPWSSSAPEPAVGCATWTQGRGGVDMCVSAINHGGTLGVVAGCYTCCCNDRTITSRGRKSKWWHYQLGGFRFLVWVCARAAVLGSRAELAFKLIS